MANADTAGFAAGQSSTELLIVGAGIMGLWAAVEAGRRGIPTMLVDCSRPGAGASAGLLGALMPHMPDRWSAKKQFQFEALISLEPRIAALEAETEVSAGYRRCGRLIPLPKPHLKTIALRHSRDAEQSWRQDRQVFHWHVLEEPPVAGWIDPQAGASGFVHDTLAARVSPRGLLRLLEATLVRLPSVRLVGGVEIASVEPQKARVRLGGGGSIAYGHCILAAGFRSFPMLGALTAPLPVALGQPVKGQAALLKADVDPGLPVIFRDGLYVVAHEGGQVAIGSTSESDFSSPYDTDTQLDALIAQARALVPVLADAPVVERWAGLRPKAVDRDPMVGPHPDHPRVLSLTGGFKVSFGLAHALADAVLDLVEGKQVNLPSNFMLESHIVVASRNT